MLTRKFLFFFLGLFFTLSSQALAQNSPQIRRLPPSLERELKLRKGGKVRIIGFVDTLKAQSLIAQSIRDSSAEELDSMSVRDTAIIMIDSSVSLTDKEWLDSMLAELPEYRMTPQGVRFQYPPEILVETTRKVVPPDTTLTSKMDPVSKEDLPLYDAMPMPRPLEQLHLPRTSIELGAGAPYLSRVDIRSLIISNQQTLVTLDGKYRLTGADEPAIKQLWQVGARGDFAFADPTLPISEQVPQLDLSAATGANKRLLVWQFDSSAHNLSRSDLGANFTIGTPSQLKLRAHASLTLLNDDLQSVAGQSVSENHAAMGIALQKQIGNSSYRIDLSGDYEQANTISAVGPTASPSFIVTRLLLEQKEAEPFQWRAGISYVSGSDAGGSTTQFSPEISMKFRLSRLLEIGAGFEPIPELNGLRELLSTNLFYSPIIALLKASNQVQYPGDMRRIVTEPVHLNIFANCFLSRDDEIHGRLSFIEKNNEPTFYSDTDSKKHTVFIASPVNTKRIEFEVGGNILLFTKDILRASILYRSATVLENALPFVAGQILPFEVTGQVQIAYEFRNISEKFFPTLEFLRLERLNNAFNFLNAEARYLFSQNFLLKCRAENILGSAGDFWTGYNEYPRSIWLSARYSF